MLKHIFNNFLRIAKAFPREEDVVDGHSDDDKKKLLL